MEEQQPPPDDFPMMDAPEPLISANTSASSSSAQRFSIVDVLGSDAGIGSGNKDIGPLPDPLHSDMHECDEAKVLQRLQELYPHTDIQKLPRHWNKHDRWTAPAVQNNNGMTQMPALELSSDFLRVTKRKGSSQNSKDAAAVRANRPIPRSCIVYYFEITVVSKGHDGYMGVGLSEKNVSLNRLPGWDQTSYGYHGDDGYFFASSGKGVEYGPTFTTRDVIGCGLNFVTREIFFTKNGQHLGVANSQQPIPLCNELYPTVGMQTADEMIDANFGQKPFMFNIRRELEAAEAATLASVASIDLPSEKVLWMNSLISNWMAHEGYSRALDALNRATGGGGQKLEQSAPALAKSESQDSTSTSTASKDSQSPAAAAEKVAETVMRSMIGLLGGGGESAAGGGARRSVVRSVQEALYEEMEQRRTVVRMVKRGQLAEAIERLDQIYPNLLDSNRQLALLLKTQYFVEMIRETSRELPPLPQDLEPLASTPRPNSHHQFAHSPSPRPSSSRGGKRSASAVDEEDAIAGTSCSGLAANQHNPVKRRSSDEECTVITQQQSMPTHLGHRQHQNGNSVTSAQQQQPEEEFMEVGDDSQGGQSALAGPGDCLLAVANGRSNGCSLLVGTPPTSTTIIDEPVADISVSTDRLLMDMGDEKEEPDCGGFANAEEQSQFEKYTSILLFGQQISQFSLNLDIEDGQVPQNCAALRQRMNEAFSLICYRDPSQSEHSYLLDQCQRDLVAKALNAAILESHGKEGISPLDKCLRRARFIREQALAYSASAIFADANRLLFGENPVASPSHSNQEMNDDESLAATAAEGTNGQEKSSPKLKRQADAQKKEM